MRRQRVIDTELHRVSEFSCPADFLTANVTPPGISTIYHGNLPVDIMVSPANADTTIFFFHGAIEKHFTIPVLSGLGISGGIDANRVFVSDPSLVLDNTLMLSWYAGNKHQPDLQDLLTEIFSKIAWDLGSKRVIFFGGSGGGFASLYFAHSFEDSLALVFNPQTSIAKYSQRAVDDYTQKAFSISRDDSEPLGVLPKSVTHDLCRLYRKRTSATVAYMQNLNDVTHVERHLHPLLAQAHPENTILTLVQPWRDGHTPPPKELLTNLLDTMTSSTHWALDLEKMGFISAIS